MALSARVADWVDESPHRPHQPSTSRAEFRVGGRLPRLPTSRRGGGCWTGSKMTALRARRTVPDDFRFESRDGSSSMDRGQLVVRGASADRRWARGQKDQGHVSAVPRDGCGYAQKTR